MLREAHEQHPNDASVFVRLAWALHRTGDKSAARFAQRVLELEPPEAWVSLSAGWLLFDLGFDDLVGRALALTKENATDEDGGLLVGVGVLAGKLAVNRGRIELAEGLFRDAYEYEPDDAQAGLELWAFLHNQGRLPLELSSPDPRTSPFRSCLKAEPRE